MHKVVYCGVTKCIYNSQRSPNLQDTPSFCLLHQGKWGDETLFINYEGECSNCTFEIEETEVSVTE